MPQEDQIHLTKFRIIHLVVVEAISIFSNFLKTRMIQMFSSKFMQMEAMLQVIKIMEAQVEE